MAEHLLITYATRRPYREIPAVSEDIRYDAGKGYWMKDGTPLVITSDFLDRSSSTKKCDQETGEDQKGE